MAAAIFNFLVDKRPSCCNIRSMKTLLISLIAVLAVGCTNPSTWDKSFNPLEKPMSRPATVEETHERNIGRITSNPSRLFSGPVDTW